jgi:hypothetical protein
MRLGKHFSTNLLVSCELRKIIIFIPQTPTFVPPFFHNVFGVFE